MSLPKEITADNVVIAHVALLSVSNGDGFLLELLDDDHPIPSARHKLDLLTVEHPAVTATRTAMRNYLKKLGANFSLDPGIIARVRNVDYYPDQDQVRDTRRTFLTCTLTTKDPVADFILETRDRNFMWLYQAEIADSNSLRRPYFRDVLLNHRMAISSRLGVSTQISALVQSNIDNPSVWSYIAQNPW